MNKMAGLDIANSVLGAGQQVGNIMMAKKQHERQKELMDIQKMNQMELNKQGVENSLDLWNRTNYTAQMEHLKKAGLNPSLLYGKGGQGGTTTGSSGGSASGGNSPLMQFDISNMLTAQKLKSEIELIKSQTEKTEAEAEKTRGVDTKLGETQIASLTQGITESESKVELNKIQTTLSNAQKNVAEANVNKLIQETRLIMIEADLNRKTFNDKAKIVSEELLKIQIEQTLLKSNISKNESEINKWAQDISIAWAKVANEIQALKFTEKGLELNGRSLDQKDQQLIIDRFNAEIKANYPNLLNSAGGIIQDFRAFIESWTGNHPNQRHNVPR